MRVMPCPKEAWWRSARPQTMAPSKSKLPIQVPEFPGKICTASSILSSPQNLPAAARAWDFRLVTASSRNIPGRLTSAPLRIKARPSGWNSRLRGKRYMSKGSILVVDDEAEIREGLELLLTTEGYSTSSAEPGEAGLTLLEKNPFA